MRLGTEARLELVIDRPREVVVLRDGLDILLEATQPDDKHTAYQSFLERLHNEACHRQPYPWSPDPPTCYYRANDEPNFNVSPTEVVLVKEASDAVVASGGLTGFIYKLSGTKRHARQLSAALSSIPSESVN